MGLDRKASAVKFKMYISPLLKVWVQFPYRHWQKKPREFANTLVHSAQGDFTSWESILRK